MTVRTATPDDVIGIVRLLREAHAAAQLPFQFSAPHAAALAHSHISGAAALSLVYAPALPQGVLLATAQDHPFAPIKYASETVWWISPDHRGTAATDMLAAYEGWAAEQGCAFAGMAALASFPRAGTIYRRRGYREAETHYLKRLAA